MTYLTRRRVVRVHWYWPWYWSGRVMQNFKTCKLCALFMDGETRQLTIFQLNSGHQTEGCSGSLVLTVVLRVEEPCKTLKLVSYAHYYGWWNTAAHNLPGLNSGSPWVCPAELVPMGNGIELFSIEFIHIIKQCAGVWAHPGSSRRFAIVELVDLLW